MNRTLGGPVAVALVALWTTACQLPGDDTGPGAGDRGTLGQTAQAVSVPAQGSATTLDIASWNLEWFGSTGNGPTDEALQLSNVRDVIAGTDFDLWGLEEVVSNTQFGTLVSELPGYAGFVANDPMVVNGSAFYSSSERCRFCVAGLPHIPFAVGFGRSGPSQTCPRTIQCAPRDTSSEPEAEGELPPSVPAVYEALTDVT